MVNFLEGLLQNVNIKKDVSDEWFMCNQRGWNGKATCDNTKDEDELYQ